MLRAIVAAFVVVLTSSSLARAADPTNLRWLPISRSDLMQIMFTSRGAQAPAVVVASTIIRKPTDPGDANGLARWAEMTAELQVIAAGGDSVWVAGTEKPTPLRVVFAGQGERVHTIRITFPIVSFRSQEDVDKVTNALSALFVRLYPDWPQAKDWWKDSLGGAWNNSPLVRQKPLTDPNEMIPRKTLNGITSATFGVPPDIVVYTITTRDACVPDLRRGDPFRRLIC